MILKGKKIAVLSENKIDQDLCKFKIIRDN